MLAYQQFKNTTLDLKTRKHKAKERRLHRCLHLFCQKQSVHFKEPHVEQINKPMLYDRLRVSY